MSDSDVRKNNARPKSSASKKKKTTFKMLYEKFTGLNILSVT